MTRQPDEERTAEEAWARALAAAGSTAIIKPGQGPQPLLTIVIADAPRAAIGPPTPTAVRPKLRTRST